MYIMNYYILPLVLPEVCVYPRYANRGGPRRVLESHVYNELFILKYQLFILNYLYCIHINSNSEILHFTVP